MRAFCARRTGWSVTSTPHETKEPRAMKLVSTLLGALLVLAFVAPPAVKLT